MKQLLTKGIILSRTDYGEADRIITLLTPEQGKLRLMARGVRKARSRLAGGIELFSTADITYMTGRGEIGTLISARLIKYYSQIVKDIDRVQLGYDLIKTLHRATEDQPEPEYFTLLEQAFAALDDADIGQQLIRLWFKAQLLKQAGHSPNLTTDTAGQKLSAADSYDFDFDAMSFAPRDTSGFTSDHIKLLRLLFSDNSPKSINQVQGIGKLLDTCAPLILNAADFYLRT
jgi:DNA repair protein RecO (recombination protein O)